MNFIEGEVKGVISAGSQYNQTEAEGISQWGFGDINYGIVKDADLYLGENFKYRAVFGGFQSIQEHVKEFYSRFAGSTENQKDILASYGFKEDGNLGYGHPYHGSIEGYAQRRWKISVLYGE